MPNRRLGHSPHTATHPSRPRRWRAWLASIPLVILLAHLPTADAMSDPLHEKTTFNIPAQPLGEALKQLADQAGVQILFEEHIVNGLRSPEVSAYETPLQVLHTLLEGTGLEFAAKDQTIAVRRKSPAAVHSTAAEPGPGTNIAPANLYGRGGRDGPVDATRLAQAGQASEATALSGAQESASQKEPPQLQEVVVTAQKRSERLLDVPAAITAIGGDRLEALQVNSLTDMASYVPGMAVEGGGSPGYRTIVLRGLNSSYNATTTGPTVATYIDDLPIGASNAGARSGQFGADLQPYDIEQVEVLKGPQGTLYGANTLAGLIKYRLRQPDLTQTTGLAGGDVEHIDGSGGVGWGIHGSVSTPLVQDVLAVRLSGFKKDAAGYIDNIGLNLKDANSFTESGGTASLLWKPTQQIAVRATFLAQDVNAANQSEVSIDPTTRRPLYGPLLVNTNFAEPNWNKLRNYTLSLDWDLGFAALTSASGYSTFENQMTEDLSAYGPLCVPDPANGRAGCPDYPHADALADYVQTDYVHKFVQEVRLQSPARQRIQWMLGGYYTRENSFESEYFPAFTPAHQPLPPRDDIVDSLGSGVYKESAAFANLTYSFNERFDVSGGERYSRYNIPASYSLTTGTLGTGPSTVPALPSTGVSVWMADARYHPVQDSTVYVRVATGYQPGGDYVPFHAGESGIVRPARTTNYELGFKGQFFDRRLQLESALFHIDWKDIQIAQIDANRLGYPGNGGTAKSDGVELAAIDQITETLRLNATLAYTDAHLTEDAPGANGLAGDQLPESPRWTGSLTADYNRPLNERNSLLLGGGYRYRDQVNNQFAGTGDPLPMRPQNIVDLYGGLMLNRLTLRLYGTNIFNNRSYSGLLFISQSQFVRYVPIQPRTIGLSLDYRL